MSEVEKIELNKSDVERYLEYVYSVAKYQKISNSVGRNDNFLVKARKLSILPTSLDSFDIRQHYIRILYILMTIGFFEADTLLHAVRQKFNPLPDDKILDRSNSKQSADDNFKFDVNSRKFSIRVENTVGKGEIDRYEQFLLFPQCFQKACFLEASKCAIV